MLRDVQLPAKELAINREIEIESVGRREGGGGGCMCVNLCVYQNLCVCVFIL